MVVAKIKKNEVSSWKNKKTNTYKRSWQTLTTRILTINIFALLILVGGLLYLDQFREGLVTAKLNSLKTEGKIIAGALSEGALKKIDQKIILDVNVASSLLRRMVEPTHERARIFASSEILVADSRSILGAGRTVQSKHLPNHPRLSLLEKLYESFAELFSKINPFPQDLSEYRESEFQKASDYNEVMLALLGKTAQVRRRSPNGLILTVAIPIQSFKQVQGALLLSSDASDIDVKVRQFRLTIIKISTLALLVTILLSLYLASTIARPVRLLAAAANRVRKIHSRHIQIPDFTNRRDEIGRLSGSLREMTFALYKRLDAIEAFAADVSHEIKNPLTSLRSAVDAFEKVTDKNQQKKLINIIRDDVQRIDRLITDISDASRLDAELSRSQMKPVDMTKILETIPLVYNLDEEISRISLEIKNDKLWVIGIEERLGQVIKNIVDNALSFAPDNTPIDIIAWCEDSSVIIICNDKGPGVAPEDLTKIFDRFYTRRPDSEVFGKHSGLGLSISHQIVEAHGGKLVAKNRKDGNNKIIGTKIILELPLHTL